MAEVQSIYWYFPATRNGIVTNASWEEHLMPFCELPAGWQQEGQRTTYQEIPPGVDAYKSSHLKKNSGTKENLK